MPLNVLYLDDEKELCDNFSDLFSTGDIKVITFNDPVKASEAAKVNPPDLMFVDYRLPSTNGDLVALSLDPKIPKFLITGDISVATSYKFVKVFSKPYKAEDIWKVLESMLKKKQAHSA